jgi:hypothetical protein
MNSFYGALLFLLFASVSAQDPAIDTLLQERYATLPLPDPAVYYGQTQDFATAIEAAYCDKARANYLYLGTNGWIFTRHKEIDFGREHLGTKELSYEEIIFWLREYRKALETVGFKEVVMMVVPPKGLLGEPYMTEELKDMLGKQNTLADYYTMRLAYLQAGFEHVPDLLRIAKTLWHEGIYAHFPTDHHFTSHSASLWSVAAARAVMNSESYAGLTKTPTTLVLLDEKREELGWEHIKLVSEHCQTQYPLTYMPYYRLQYPESEAELLEEVRNEIVVVGNSNIGFEFNRPGSYGETGTPGTGTSDFLAHLTHLPVLKYGIYSLANSAIEQYLRTDFLTELPPSYLVHYTEAHVYPYPPYHYRTLPALTYGKCQEPVFETTAERKRRITLDLSGAIIVGDSANYYFWLELDVAAEQQSFWIVEETYSSGLKDALVLATDDRFTEFPTFFALQLRPGKGRLETLQVTPEPGWEGQSITVSLCDIRQVTEAYKALGR